MIQILKRKRGDDNLKIIWACSFMKNSFFQALSSEFQFLCVEMSFISNIFFTDDASYLSENEVEVSKRILSFLSIMKDVLVSRPSRNVANQTLDKLDQV